MSIPHMGHGSAPMIDIMARKMFTENGLFFYNGLFPGRGRRREGLEADIRDTVRRIYYAWSGDPARGDWPAGKKHGEGLLSGMINPEKFPDWLPDEDIDYMVSEFTSPASAGR